MELYTKLLKVKSELGKISKDSTNPFYKSKYFDINSLLEQVDPILQKHELVLIQPIHDNRVRTEIVNPADGDMIFSEMELPMLTDPQKLGSAITYYRRYTLQSLLGLQAEDDDGNKASSPKQTAQANIQAVSNVEILRVSKLLADINDLDELQNEFKREAMANVPQIKQLFTRKKLELSKS